MKKSIPYLYAITLILVVGLVWWISEKQVKLLNVVVALLVLSVGTFTAFWRYLSLIQTKINVIEEHIGQTEIKRDVVDRLTLVVKKPYVNAIVWLAVIGFIWIISPPDIRVQNIALVLPGLLILEFKLLWSDLTKLRIKLDDLASISKPGSSLDK